jgi:hypothetical protein
VENPTPIFGQVQAFAQIQDDLNHAIAMYYAQLEAMKESRLFSCLVLGISPRRINQDISTCWNISSKQLNITDRQHHERYGDKVLVLTQYVGK